MRVRPHKDRELIVIPIDGSYLYRIGKAIQQIEGITVTDARFDAFVKSIQAREALDTLINRSIYIESLKFTRIPAETVVRLIDQINAPLFEDHSKNQEPVDRSSFYALENAIKEFETIFKAEFQQGSLFLATPKGGYDLQKLITSGESLLPPALAKEVPDAVLDVREGTKCIAFELYTAAGFHLHRATESVLLKYLGVLSGGNAKPKNRNMGAYIKVLEDQLAPAIIISCLRDLKDMHRNPLMHPEQSIENLDDAIALLNSIYTAISAMLKDITRLNQAVVSVVP